MCDCNTLLSLQLNSCLFPSEVDLWKGMIPSLPQTAMTQNPEAAEFVKARDELQSATFSLSKRNKKSTFEEGNMTRILSTYICSCYFHSQE